MRLRSTTLGWLVIAYAGLNWMQFLNAQGLVLGLVFRRSLPSAYEIVGVVAWMALLAGGIGLVRGKKWGRRTAVAALAVMIGVQSFLLARAGTPGSVEPAALQFLLVLGALQLVPPLFLLFAALRPATQVRVEPASVATPVRAVPDEAIRRLDRAYGVFTAVTIAVTGMALVSLIPTDLVNVQVWGLLVGVPLGLAALVAAVMGLVYTARCFREWPLPLMSVLMISIPLVAGTYDVNVPGRAILVQAWVAIALAAMFFLCARWFVLQRKRRTRTTP